MSALLCSSAHMELLVLSTSCPALVRTYPHPPSHPTPAAHTQGSPGLPPVGNKLRFLSRTCASSLQVTAISPVPWNKNLPRHHDYQCHSLPPAAPASMACPAPGPAQQVTRTLGRLFSAADGPRLGTLSLGVFRLKLQMWGPTICGQRASFGVEVHSPR